MLTDVIDKYGVYLDTNLKNVIYDMEQRFEIRDETVFFNQLVNFSGNIDIPYHGWFKYREGFSHTLIKELIGRSGIGRGEYVLDPFCGSGTTVVEAALNGFSAVGIDINPMSAFLSKVKCRSYTDGEIERIQNILLQLIHEMQHSSASDDYCRKYQEVEKFFSERNFQRLLCIRQVLDCRKNEIGTKLYEFFLCAYICIVEEVSDRKRDGNGLKTMASKIAEAELFYCSKVQEMIADIRRFPIAQDIFSEVSCGDAMQLSDVLKKCSVLSGRAPGAIMYSPPYANSFDYFESYKMEVILADYAADMKEIGTFRQQAVESFIGRSDRSEEPRDFIRWMSDEIESAIPQKEARTGKRDARTRKVPKMIRGYFSDMEKVIRESAEVLEAKKKCYIIVDQSAYLGKIVPTDLFFAAIAENYGFRVSEIIVCRTAKTSGQQIQQYPYLRDSLRESIVVLERV